jgi:hypothetical protein
MARVGAATTIAYTWTADELTVAADSMLSDDTCHSLGSVCKIKQVGNIFAALSARRIRPMDDPNPWFDGHAVIDSVLRQGKPMRESIADLEVAMTKALTKAVDELKNAGTIPPRDTQKWLSDKLNVAVILFGVEKSVIRLSERAFEARVVSTGNIEIHMLTQPLNYFDCPGPTCKWWDAIGYFNAIEDRLKEDVSFLKTIAPADLPRYLVQIEIDSPRDRCTVGGPINVLRIDRNGAKWKKHPSCPEIQEPESQSLPHRLWKLLGGS